MCEQKLTWANWTELISMTVWLPHTYIETYIIILLYDSPDRNQILFCCVFWAHHQVQSRAHMSFVDVFMKLVSLPLMEVEQYNAWNTMTCLKPTVTHGGRFLSEIWHICSATLSLLYCHGRRAVGRRAVAVGGEQLGLIWWLFILKSQSSWSFIGFAVGTISEISTW